MMKRCQMHSGRGSDGPCSHEEGVPHDHTVLFVDKGTVPKRARSGIIESGWSQGLATKGQRSTRIEYLRDILAPRMLSLVATASVVVASVMQVPCSWASNQETLPVIADYAKVLPSGTIDSQMKKLEQLEKDTGFKVRVLSRYTDSQGNIPSVEDLRVGWDIREDVGTYVVVFVDPSAPNVLSFKYGKKVQAILSRPFFTELQSRYGNMFYVRDEGEEKSISSTLDALDYCLRREDGCAVPPGLPEEQYIFTLICCVLGGFILGASLRLQPQGFVKRQWVYAVLFGPLWLTLSLSYGIGPVVSRTDDPLPVVANIAATIASALLIKNYPEAANTVGLSVSSTMDEDTDDTRM